MNTVNIYTILYLHRIRGILTVALIHNVLTDVQLIQTIIILFEQIDERTSVSEGSSFVDYQTNLVRLAKQIARTAQEMVTIFAIFCKNCNVFTSLIVPIINKCS